MAPVSAPDHTPALPDVGDYCCASPDERAICLCANRERVLHAIMAGAAREPLSLEARREFADSVDYEYCEASGREALLAIADDREFARVVYGAWADYARDQL